MAKFSDFQDLNKDGLVDKCVVDLPVIQEPCPTCIPNPHALRTDWTKKTHLETFLNERECEYVIVYRSNYKDTGGVGNSAQDKRTIIQRWEESKEDALRELLEMYAKQSTPEIISRLMPSVTYKDKDWNLNVIPNSRMKFRYRVDAEIFNSIPETPPNVDMPTASIEIEYDVNELRLTLLRISKGLHLYSRYIKVYSAVEGGSIISSKTGSKFNLVPYGDKNGKVRRILPELLKFYWSKGWVLNGSLLPGFGKKAAERIVFGFNDDYTLSYISVWEHGCKHVSYTLKSNQLNALKNKTPFNDPTAMAYLAKANDMENDLISRVPKDWLQFLEEYTYPPLFIQRVDQGNYDPFAEGTPLQQQAQSAMSCLADDLGNEFKELWGDIKDDAFGIGDAIAYKFRDKICGTEDSAKKDAEEVGWFSVYDPKTRQNRNVYAMAQEQAFAQLEANDQVFVELCARIFSLLNVSGGYQKMDELWAQVFGPLKICGLSDLMTDVIQCLLGGLGLEEALAKAILSALNAMGVDDLGKLFIGLPPDKQREIEALVMRRLQAGDVPGFNPEKQRVVPPWESESAREQSANRLASGGPVDSPVPVDRGQPYSAPSTRRTLAQQFDTSINDPYRNIDPNNILQVYIAALIEVYGSNLMDLADELNKFPGAPVIATIIATFDCPRPPLFDPGLFDWLKDIQLPWCRNNKDINYPRLNMAPPMSLADIFKALIEAAKEAILELVMRTLTAIIVKICEILGDMICKALEAVGALAASLPSLISGENTISNVLRDVFCGPEVTQAEVEQVTMQLIGTLGEGGAAMANPETVNNWTAGVSSMLTQRELAELFTGQADDSTLNIIHEYTQLDVPEFAQSLASPSDVADFFNNIGNLFPPEFSAELQSIVNADDILADKPINPSLCATPEKLDEFKAARCALLEGRATKEQCDKLYADLKDQLLDDLEDISTVFQKGPEAHIADQMPPMISTPGCQDGFFPYEPEEVTVARKHAQDSLYNVVKVAFRHDLIGDGPWAWQWGFVNLVLSDVNGVAYTTHQKKSTRLFNYVDYVNEEDVSSNPFGPSFPPLPANFLSSQQGAYPVDVAGWLQDYLSDEHYKPPERDVFKNDTDWKPARKKRIVIEPNPLILTMLDLAEDTQFTFITIPGYKPSDFRAKFRDNAKGMPSKFPILGVSENKKGLDGDDEAYGYGFDIHMSISDLVEDNKKVFYRDGDWTTLRIYERRNNGYSDMIVANDSSFGAQFGPGKSLAEKLSGQELGVSTNIIEAPNSRDPHTAIIQETLSTEVKQILNDLPPIEYGFNAAASTKPDNKFSPQVQRLVNYINTNQVIKNAPGGSITSESSYRMFRDYHEAIMNKFVNSMFETISADGLENPAFNYGALPDNLSPADILYVNPSDYTDGDGEFHRGGAPYSIPSSEAVMGISAAQYAGSNLKDRIHYLNPATFGGTYAFPGLYIEPPRNKGWLGFLDALVPEEDGCKPKRSDLIDFSDVSDRVQDLYTKIPDDPRLRMGPECRLEVPYARILDRASASNLEGVVMIAIRVFASMHFIKSMATYSKFTPSFPDNFSSIVSAFIIQEMETRFKENERRNGESLFKDHRYWYAFLEQCVQIYDRKVTLGEVEPSPEAIEAFRSLNDLQEGYEYPDKFDLKTARNENLQYLDKYINNFSTLKKYRNLKNLHFVRETENHAKNIMKHLVEEELNKLGAIFSENLKAIDMDPSIKHIGKYFLSEEAGMINGTSLNLNQNFTISVEGVPTTPTSNLYTEGGEFLRQDGTEYVGRYHIHVDRNRGPIAMEGARHRQTQHDELVPVSSRTVIQGDGGLPYGDVAELGAAFNMFDTDRPEEEGMMETKMFALEKIMRITPKDSTSISAGLTPLTSGLSGIVSPSQWTSYLNSLPRAVANKNFSDYYGNLKFAYDPLGNSQEPIGIEEGTSVGVEYGLRLSLKPMRDSNEYFTLAEVFVDALDGPMNQFEEYSASSRILYCLVDNLVDSPEFKFITEYIFPLRKAAAFVALYNHQAFLPSIGEIVADYGDDVFSNSKKPGRRVDDDGNYDEDGSIRGWEPYAKRMRFQQNSSPSTWFEKGFDEWDREVLKSTLPEIKSLFMSYYKSRDFDWGEDSTDGVGYLLEQMRESLRPPAGARYLPWWQRGRLRKRPLNKNGGMCSSSDED